MGLQTSSSGSAHELESEWGIPHHHLRRALVCHAVFGPHHRFLRRACWFAGFVETLPNSSVDVNDNNALDSAEVDDIETGLVAAFGNETNASDTELTSAWGIPHHPLRRALVCHAVFGPHHRFLRRACWFAGFVEVLPNSSVDLNDNTTALESAEVDDIEASLVATFGNATNASNIELTSAWGIPHHPIRRALVCRAVFGPHHRFLRRACWWSGR